MPRFLGFQLDESQQAVDLREKSANGYAPQDLPMLEALGILQKRRGQLRINSALNSSPAEIRTFLKWALGDKKYPLPPLVRKILCIKRTLIKDGVSSVKTSSALRLNEENLLVEIDKMLKADGMKNPDSECATVGGTAETLLDAKVTAAVNDCPNLCDTVNETKKGVDKLLATPPANIDANALASTISASIVVPGLDADALASTISASIVVPGLDADALASTISASIVVPGLDADALTSTISASIVVPPPTDIDADALASKISAGIVIPDAFANTIVQKIKTEGGYATSANIQTLSTTLTTAITNALASVKVDGLEAVQTRLGEILTKINSATPAPNSSKLVEIERSVTDLLTKYTSLTAAIQDVSSKIQNLPTPAPVQIPELAGLITTLNTFSSTVSDSFSSLTSKIDSLPTSLDSLKSDLLTAIGEIPTPETVDLTGIKTQLENVSSLLQTPQISPDAIAEIKTMVSDQNTKLDSILGLLTNSNGETVFTVVNRLAGEIQTIKTAAQSSTDAMTELLDKILAGVSNTSPHDKIVGIVETHRTETSDYLKRLDAIEAAVRGLSGSGNTDALRSAITDLEKRFDDIQSKYDEHVQTMLQKISESRSSQDDVELLNAIEFLVEDSGRKNTELSGIKDDIHKLVDELADVLLKMPENDEVVRAVTEAVNKSIDDKILGKLDRIAQQSSQGLGLLQEIKGGIASILGDISSLKESVGSVLGQLSAKKEDAGLQKLYTDVYGLVEQLKNEIAALATKCTGGQDCSGVVDAVRGELGNLKAMFGALETQHANMMSEVSRFGGLDAELKAQRALIGELGQKLDAMGSTIARPVTPAAVDTSEFVRQVQQLREEIGASQRRCCEDVLNRLKGDLFEKFEELKRTFESRIVPEPEPPRRYEPEPLPPVPEPVPEPVPQPEPEPEPEPDRFDTLRRSRAEVPPPVAVRPPSRSASPTSCQNEDVLRTHPLECIEKAVLKREKDPVKMNANIRAIKQFIFAIPTLSAGRLSKELGKDGKIKYMLHEFLRGDIESLSRKVASMTDKDAQQEVTNYFVQKAKERGDLKYIGGSSTNRFTRKQKKNISLKRRRRVPTE